MVWLLFYCVGMWMAYVLSLVHEDFVRPLPVHVRVITIIGWPVWGIIIGLEIYKTRRDA